MKKLALTNLIVLFAIKSVSACWYLDGYGETYHESVEIAGFYSKLYFLLSVALISANFLIFYLREQKDYLILFALVPILVIWTLFVVFGNFLEECSIQIGALKWGIIIFLPFVIFQVILWITKRGLHLSEKNPLDITSIKLN